MTESISAAEANRQFSRLLRGVREEGATYIVTAHGRPVAKIVPLDAADEAVVPAAEGEAIRTNGRLTLEQLWQRARKLGAGFPSESAAIARADRDDRNRR